MTEKKKDAIIAKRLLLNQTCQNCRLYLENRSGGCRYIRVFYNIQDNEKQPPVITYEYPKEGTCIGWEPIESYDTNRLVSDLIKEMKKLKRNMKNFNG